MKFENYNCEFGVRGGTPTYQNLSHLTQVICNRPSADTFNNAVDNYANVEDSNTYDTYKYVNFYDNLDNYNSVEAQSNLDRNSHHEHQESSSNLDTYSSTSQAGVGEGRYKTMMSGMMTDMIKSTVSTAVDTVMESGSAKVSEQFSQNRRKEQLPKVAMIVSAIVFTQTSILNFVYYLDSVRR